MRDGSVTAPRTDHPDLPFHCSAVYPQPKPQFTLEFVTAWGTQEDHLPLLGRGGEELEGSIQMRIPVAPDFNSQRRWEAAVGSGLGPRISLPLAILENK